MKMLTETIVSICDLAEAEGRLLKHKVVQTISVGLLLLIAAAMLLAALALLITSLYHLLANWMPPSAVFLILSLFSLLLAGGILWTAIRLNRKP
ncbi:hypothetical protein [Leucothrix pacifica]|uniref:Uncharacterized protein n=1 Tax=Leucothrix pacifica TaxID=1247513 RepID=A0A317CNW1_9GAMM|nr:hypothetical protein [Leucothrix pacifica]PWQ99887.1 hypothetical protein DKW60_04265 [Leucothrix pacifica]